MQAILNNVLPVFIIIALGQGMMRLGLAGPEFFRVSDKLVYFIFFPVMLFWKIGVAQIPPGVLSGAAPAVLTTVILVWLASVIWARRTGVSPFQAGTFSQVTYRFNSYMGMAVIMYSLGEEGIAVFGVVISLAIPVINVLAVSTLVWYSQAQYGGWEKVRMVVRAMLVNPLILGCLAGIAFGRSGLAMPEFLQNTFRLLSAITLPLALLSIGGGLSLHKLKDHLRLSAVAAGFKLLLLPLVGWICLELWGVEGMPYQATMIFFTLPTATSAYILSAQLKSDTELAASSIVLSTLLSFFSLSFALWAFV